MGMYDSPMEMNMMLFLPHVFGYSAAMSQILTKCGIDHFVPSKISWNETNCSRWTAFEAVNL